MAQGEIKKLRQGDRHLTLAYNPNKLAERLTLQILHDSGSQGRITLDIVQTKQLLAWLQEKIDEQR